MSPCGSAQQGIPMNLMIKNLADPEPIDVAEFKLGDHCVEICVDGALIEVPIYDEDDKLDLAPCARADHVPEEARSSG